MSDLMNQDNKLMDEITVLVTGIANKMTTMTDNIHKILEDHEFNYDINNAAHEVAVDKLKRQHEEQIITLTEKSKSDITLFDTQLQLLTDQMAELIKNQPNKADSNNKTWETVANELMLKMVPIQTDLDEISGLALHYATEASEATQKLSDYRASNIEKETKIRDELKKIDAVSTGIIDKMPKGGRKK